MSTLWGFEYSAWYDCKPGEHVSRTSEFLNILQEYRCINLSANGKTLKPTTELTTLERQRSLIYLLDIFPGLYCQRVTAAGPQPVSTTSQPVLLVTFLSQNPAEPQPVMHHPDSRLRDNHPQPAESHRLHEIDHRAAGNEGPLPPHHQQRVESRTTTRDQRMSGVEPDYGGSRRAINDGNPASLQPNDRTRRMDSRRAGNEKERAQNSAPTPKETGVLGRLFGYK